LNLLSSSDELLRNWIR